MLAEGHTKKGVEMSGSRDELQLPLSHTDRHDLAKMELFLAEPFALETNFWRESVIVRIEIEIDSY
jgi:hypothetical protein